MDISELQPADGHVVVIKSGVDVETLGELIGFDLEEQLDEELGCLDILEEAWGGVIIGGDLTISGDTTSEKLPLGLEGFADGFPISDEGYVPVYFIVVLGDLTVDGHLEVEQYRDLYVKGNVKVNSYGSASGNFLCSGALTARDIICTEVSDEGGILSAREAIAPVWFSSGSLDYQGLEDMEFDEDKRISAEEFTEDREQAIKAVSFVLGKEIEDKGGQFFDAVQECVDAGKLSEFLQAYKDAK